jgi:hypothetical protein
MGISTRFLIRYRVADFVDDSNHGGLWDIARNAVEHFGAGRFLLDQINGTRGDKHSAIQWNNARYGAVGDVIGGDFDEWDCDVVTRATFGTVLARAHLQSSYWAPDCRRGDFGFVCDLADWLETVPRAKPVEIIYGGDSSGVRPITFTRELRQSWRAIFDAEG